MTVNSVHELHYTILCYINVLNNNYYYTDCRPATFLREFADIIERIAIYTTRLIVLGDINIHMDNVQALTTAKFTNILSDFDLVQHVTGPTHSGGHTLDVFNTLRGTQSLVTVEPPSSETIP